MHENVKHRATLLAALYEAREKSPRKGWLYIHELNALVAEPEFALEILKEQGCAADLGGKYRITAKGALAHEATQQD